MGAVDTIGGNEVVGLANSLLNDLKTSYPIWEDLVSKSSKLHSSLRLAIQHSSAFVDAIQKVADLAWRTYGGSREIGACLTRLCLRQRRLETKMKSMNNHLITSLATPLSTKMDEWRRALCQLEKDRARQTKRARCELKRAVSDASRWQKKMAKCGGGTCTADLGPGVGHGVMPTSNSSVSKANEVATHVNNALHMVQIKTELYEKAETAAVKGLMLEERGRFCFFLSCLLPVLECQVSMLTEVSAIDELMHTLSKSASNTTQLADDVDPVLLRMGRSVCTSQVRNNPSSIHELDRSSSLIAAATTALYANLNRTPAGSSDTDSGRLTMEQKLEDQLDNCSLTSSSQFHLGCVTSNRNSVNCSAVVQMNNSNNNHIPNGINPESYSISDDTCASIDGASSHSSNDCTGNPSYGSVGKTFNRNVISELTSVLMSVNDQSYANKGLFERQSVALSGSVRSLVKFNDHTPAIPCLAPTAGSYTPKTDESQFQTLRRPRRHTASTGEPTLPRSSQMMTHLGCITSPRNGSEASYSSEVNLVTLPGHLRPTVDQDWLRSCDYEDKDDDDDEEDLEDSGDDSDQDLNTNHSSTLIATAEDEGGDYVEVQDDMKQCNSGFTIQNDVLSVESSNHRDALFYKDTMGSTSGRHTISSVYEKGSSAHLRTPIQNLSFIPPIGKSSSKDSGVDSSMVLYPNQALPPPVYTNLTQLAHEAQRKFSIPNLPTGSSSSGVFVLPPNPSRCSSTETTLPSDTGADIPNPTFLTTSTSGENRSGFMRPQLSSISSLPHRLSSASTTVTDMARLECDATDPFSVELDELDKLGGTGSSCASSSLTMASSTTSESLLSSNGRHVPNSNDNASDCHASGSSKFINEISMRNTVNLFKCGASGHPSVPIGLVTHPRQPINETVPTAVHPMSTEAANLMSELSLQLQQLAARGSDDTSSRQPDNGACDAFTDDNFDLPPPPPAAMFQNDSSSLDH